MTVVTASRITISLSVAAMLISAAANIITARANRALLPIGEQFDLPGNPPDYWWAKDEPLWNQKLPVQQALGGTAYPTLYRLHWTWADKFRGERVDYLSLILWNGSGIASVVATGSSKGRSFTEAPANLQMPYVNESHGGRYAVIGLFPTEGEVSFALTITDKFGNVTHAVMPIPARPSK